MPRKARTNLLLLTDVELDIMRCVWDKGSASASGVQMDMVRKGKETAYTTVKTMLDRLVRAGVCSSKEVRGRYVYTAKLSQEAVAREWYTHLHRMIYGSSKMR